VYWNTHEQAAAAVPALVTGAAVVKPVLLAVTVTVAVPFAAKPLCVIVFVDLATVPEVVDNVYVTVAS
jgi:hypothetical protein